MKFLENITCHLLIDLLEWRLVTPLHVPAACQSGPVEATRPRNVESVSFFVCLTSGQKKNMEILSFRTKMGPYYSRDPFRILTMSMKPQMKLSTSTEQLRPFAEVFRQPNRIKSFCAGMSWVLNNCEKKGHCREEEQHSAPNNSRARGVVFSCCSNPPRRRPLAIAGACRRPPYALD